MEEEVPNLKGGLPKWFFWLFGVLMTIGMWAAPYIANVIKAADNPAQIQDLARAVTAIQLDIGVMKARQEGAAALQELHNKNTDSKLDILLRKGK